MVIVVPDAGWRDAIAALLVEHRTLQTVIFETHSGHPEQVLVRVRARHGPAPIAYVAASELQALQAIDAGADEALHLTPETTSHALILIQRAARRAARRHAIEESHTLAVRAEKLAALETVVAAVAHEINNPLAAVCLSAEYLRSVLPSLEGLERAADARRMLDDLLDMVDNIAAIVRDLRSYARSGEEDALETVDVTELVDQVLRVMGSDLAEVAHVERDYALELPRVTVPRSRVVQVITNLLVNATHAMREVERPVHRVRITVRADDEAVAISISDTGTGISPSALDLIFEPYFTTKPEGRGTGLGLSISRSIMLRLGGDLLVESVHGQGATFIVFIPRTKREVSCEKPAHDLVVPARQRRPALLLVEDDERLLRLYPRVFRDHFDVLTAADGQEAIDLLNSGVHVDAVVSDLNMPELDGEQLFRWLQRYRPELATRTLFVSGAADPRRGFLAEIANEVLQKPVSSQRLISGVSKLLGRPLGRAAE